MAQSETLILWHKNINLSITKNNQFNIILMEKSQEFMIKLKKHKIPFTSVNEIRSVYICDREQSEKIHME